MRRITAVRKLLDASDADAIVLTFPPQVRWVSGFTGSAALVYLDRSRACLVTDGRYRDQAADEATEFEVHIAPANLIAYLGGTGWLGEAPSILAQGEHISFSEMQRLRSTATDSVVHAQDGLLDGLVAAKDDDEIACIRTAQEITDEVFLDLLEWLAEGMTEQEVATEIIYQHLRRGAERMSFEPIVASGPNGALPHARPGSRSLTRGDLVVLDFGCVWQGYCSDMTRTVAIGHADGLATEVFDIVREAQAHALAAARSGMPARDLDRVAREHIERLGYGEQFSHSLGHGVGLQVHEWPRVASSSDDSLPDGAVISVEPGIYVPGRFGVRIEDLVVLHPDGCRNLTGAPKDLVII